MKARASAPAPFPAAQSWLLDNPLTRAMAARFVRQLDLTPGMHVLDVGCGPGRLTIPIARAVGNDGKVVAMDVQQEMLARVARRAAAARLSNVRTLRASAGGAELPSRSFDLALLAYVLGEIPSDGRSAAIGEIARALRPDGRLVVAEGATDPHRQSVDAVRDLAAAAGLRLDATRRGPLNTVMTLRPELVRADR